MPLMYKVRKGKITLHEVLGATDVYVVSLDHRRSQKKSTVAQWFSTFEEAKEHAIEYWNRSLRKKEEELISIRHDLSYTKNLTSANVPEDMRFVIHPEGNPFLSRP